MTVPATTRKAGPFNGNGSTTSFPFTFKVFTDEDIEVVVADADGVETVLVLDSDYSVVINGDQDVSPGGTVTYPISGSALASGEKLSIVGALSYDQETDLPAGGNFNPTVLENALDKLSMQIQQLDEQSARALQVPVTSSLTSDELIAELASGAATATAAATSASASATAAQDSATDAAASASTAQSYVGNIIQNPILGDDVFSGNGSTTAFTLSRNMSTGNETALLVTISGVTQDPTASYSVSGTTLTFTSAPPSGSSNIRVRYIGALAVNAALASTAATNAATSASAAATSASAASTSASNASTSATNAASSATAAAGSASSASTSATNASNSASSASTSATNAASSATSAAGSASSASTSASSAASSATAASGYLAPVVSTSSTSLTIGTGSKSLTIETGKQWVAGMPIKIAVTASPSTNYMTGTVTSYNSGTGALVVDVSAVGGSGTYSAWTLSLQSGTSAALTTKMLRARYLTSGTSYTPASDVKEFYAQVYGATGGASAGSLGGIGGPGYSEKYYPAPSGSYTYSIGAGGVLGTAGGTTTFDVMSVTGSAGVSTTTGGAGGVGSGGDFNASGGAGGNRVSTSYGGSGGAGSRAGNGGTGGIDGGSNGQGGTGGNNASGTTPGAAATAPSGSAIVMPWGGASESFYGLGNGGLGGGAVGVPILSNSYSYMYGPGMYYYAGVNYPAVVPGGMGGYTQPFPYARYFNSATGGFPGVIVIIEVLK